MWAASGVYAPPMLVCFQRDPVPLFSCEVHLAISWKLVAGQAFVVGGVHDERLRGTICEKTRPVFKNNLVVLIETGPQNGSLLKSLVQSLVQTNIPPKGIVKRLHQQN